MLIKRYQKSISLIKYSLDQYEDNYRILKISILCMTVRVRIIAILNRIILVYQKFNNDRAVRPFVNNDANPAYRTI